MTEVTNACNFSDDPNSPIDDDRNRPLHLAAASGDEKWLERELLRGAKIDVENYLGWTPLMMATRNGHYNVAAVLLNTRADATRKNKFGISVFHLSIANGNEELILLILQYLLRGGVSKLSMESALSPLSVALLFKRNSILTLLINKSFDVNAATLYTALTPLMFAAAMNNMAAYQLLLANNANVNLKNLNEETAQDIIDSQKKLHNNTTTQQPIASPHPSMITLQVPDQPRHKKSPDVMSTPTIFFSPVLSPVTPLAFHHQIFFPSDFSPGHLMSPMNFGTYRPLEMAQTPMMQFPINFSHVPMYSPCLNERIDPSSMTCFMECSGEMVTQSPV